MRAMSLSALLLIAVLAGCTDDPAPAPTPTPPPESPYNLVAGFEVPFNGTDCQEGIVMILVDLSQAQKNLPPGYTAADAQGFLGSPTPLNKGAVGVNSISCKTSSLNGTALNLGAVAVLVNAPAAGASLPATTLDMYELISYTDNEQLLDIYYEVNASYSEATIAVSITTQPTGSVIGSGSVKDAEGKTVYSYGITGASPGEFQGVARFWSETQNGTLIVDYGFTTPQDVGQGGGSCTLTAGGPAAVAAGTTSCQPGQSLALGLPNENWTGVLRYQPKGNATA